MPIAIDLFCGLGGWTDGLLAEGWTVYGFDIEQHIYGEHRYPAQLVVQDVMTLHGSQFRNADLIVASPPCQEYSYMAMPWTKAKAKAAAIRADDTGAELERLNRLFNACFRIQAEASLAAGRHIPMIVENVKGAQPWVGRARWLFGSFALWGDVPALMPITVKARKVAGFRFDGSGGNFQTAAVEGVKVGMASWRHPDDPRHIQGLGFNTHADRNIKNSGSSWFNVAHNTTSGKGQNPDGRKVPDRIVHIRDGAPHTRHLTNPNEHGIKCSGDWFNDSQPSISRMTSSKSPARKMASTMIAKIPLLLSRYIAKTFKPPEHAEAAE
jgi:hypothetical protein